ncbi:MAG: winged helix-turn-helix domain-containing protein [Nanoarchaeota archaeon]
MERRDKVKIIYDILKSVQEKGGRIKPTHLLYKSNLSYKRMNELVQELMGKGMIAEESVSSGKMYILTDKGHKFLNEYHKMVEFIKGFGF